MLWSMKRLGQDNNIELKRFSNKTVLFGSIEWLKFSNRVDRRSLQGIKVLYLCVSFNLNILVMVIAAVRYIVMYKFFDVSKCSYMVYTHSQSYKFV